MYKGTGQLPGLSVVRSVFLIDLGILLYLRHNTTSYHIHVPLDTYRTRITIPQLHFTCGKSESKLIRDKVQAFRGRGVFPGAR